MESGSEKAKMNEWMEAIDTGHESVYSPGAEAGREAEAVEGQLNTLAGESFLRDVSTNSEAMLKTLLPWAKTSKESFNDVNSAEGVVISELMIAGTTVLTSTMVKTILMSSVEASGSAHIAFAGVMGSMGALALIAAWKLGLEKRYQTFRGDVAKEKLEEERGR